MFQAGQMAVGRTLPTLTCSSLPRGGGVSIHVRVQDTKVVEGGGPGSAAVADPRRRGKQEVREGVEGK